MLEYIEITFSVKERLLGYTMFVLSISFANRTILVSS